MGWLEKNPNETTSDIGYTALVGIDRSYEFERNQTDWDSFCLERGMVPRLGYIILRRDSPALYRFHAKLYLINPNERDFRLDPTSIQGFDRYYTGLVWDMSVYNLKFFDGTAISPIVTQTDYTYWCETIDPQESF